MHSENTTDNYDCTPLLSKDNNTKFGTSQMSPACNGNWLKRVFNSKPLFEKSLSTIRSTSFFQQFRDNGHSRNDSDSQWNNSCGQQYGVNGGYTCNRVCSTGKVDVPKNSTKSIRIYWRVM